MTDFRHRDKLAANCRRSTSPQIPRHPPDRVWALLADAGSWPRWAPFDAATVEEGEGAGELRRFQAGRRTTRERVTAFEPSPHLGYELVSGIPIRDYRADVTLTPTGDGTEIRWRSSFRSKIPGTGGLARRGLQRFIQRTAEGLAREAEVSAPAGSE